MPVKEGDGRSVSQKIRDLSEDAGELADEVAQELRDLRTRIENSERALVIAHQQRHNANERNVNLNTELHSMIAERDEQVRKYNEVAERAEREVRDAKDEARAATMNAAALRDELAASERRRIALGNSIDNVQEDHEDLERQLAEANDRINELEADINPETAEYKKVEELESKLKVKDAVIRETRLQRDNLRRQAEIANLETERARSRRLAMATELNAKNDEMVHLRSQVGALRQEAAKLKEGRPDTYEALSQALAEMNEANASQRDEINLLRGMRENDTQALITARSKIIGLEEQVRDLRLQDGDKVSRDLVVAWRDHVRDQHVGAIQASKLGEAAVNAAIQFALNKILGNRKPGQVGPN